ncbi:uncharacterized protein V1510DRAFT_363957 [Dipodascopsis tothii]|uniref:uncharacterized protein n=1 Tax=Dipodascopsis tothii TaxID=44089 RepID=UPI0034D00DEA
MTADDLVETQKKRAGQGHSIFTTRLEETAAAASTSVAGAAGVHSSHVITPGEVVTSESTWMRGHGTYAVGGTTYASVAGRISRVNKLLSVTPLRGRYTPEVGDHVVGRITDVGQRSWRVDIGAKQDAILMLGSINLPGGVLRRKSESDELNMRAFLKEGDLLNAEVQAVFSHGAASLHTRSLSYGKLRNGCFVGVPPSLVLRSKSHSHALPGGVDIVLGVNGYIWLRKHTPEALPSAADNSSAGSGVSITRLSEEAGLEIYSDRNDAGVDTPLRTRIARYSNCIRALAHEEIGISVARITSAYEISLGLAADVGALVENHVKAELAREVLQLE